VPAVLDKGHQRKLSTPRCTRPQTWARTAVDTRDNQGNARLAHFAGPVVVSRMVWCSISASSSAPSSTTVVDSHIQVMKLITAPREP